jgi:hypothetical protein
MENAAAGDDPEGGASYQQVQEDLLMWHLSVACTLYAGPERKEAVCHWVQGSAPELGLGEEYYPDVQQQQQQYTSAQGGSWEGQQGEAQQAAGEAGHSSEPPVQEVTWELIVQWAAYYRSQGSSEEELRAWVATEYPAFAGYELPLGADAWGAQPEQQATGAAAETGAEQQHEEEGLQTAPAAQELQWQHHGDESATSEAQDAEQLHADAQEAPQEGQPGKDGAQAARRYLSEIQSNAADYGSSKGHMDDMSSVGTVRALAFLHSSLIRHGMLSRRCVRAGRAGERARAAARRIGGCARLREHRLRQADWAAALGQPGRPL